ncbi:hypothetical protein BCR41DRAFT_346184 [Lobosporangium transversale]|uniref:C2 domain-containing protein n=1 Tax=Lobosporangium transversale TaxID=64571 RepID=A0A1Y2H1L8_9FUNG|nr:hypothetical protein BCR41DRAFT_346184 [Lobosporangium transversale]ORZ27891.1 hypothetical protein BCR41DRAFT_346184 [Lobosporangium transversale]|eukprot:XP_021885594.1 hypothetical protein BCR41DRAFT_346184 [Lobosporangium transversale]
MRKLFGGRHHVNKPLPEPLVDPDEGKTPIGELIIIPIQGRDLPNRERFGKQSPFILFKLGNQCRRSTTDVRGGQRPRWKDDQIKIPMYESDAKDATSLYVTCLDEDHQKNELIGDCVINLAKVLEYGEHDDWFELHYKGREAGELMLQLTYYSHDPKHPLHKMNRAPSTPIPAGTPLRRPIHPSPHGTSDHSPSVESTTSVSSVTTTATEDSELVYKPPVATEPTAYAGGYPYVNSTSAGAPPTLGGRISPVGQNPYNSYSASPYMSMNDFPGHPNLSAGQPFFPQGAYPAGYPPHMNVAASDVNNIHGGGYPPRPTVNLHGVYPTPQYNAVNGYPPQLGNNAFNTGYPPQNNTYPPQQVPPPFMPINNNINNVNDAYRPLNNSITNLYPPVQPQPQPQPVINNQVSPPNGTGYLPPVYPFATSNLYPSNSITTGGGYPPQSQIQMRPLPQPMMQQSRNSSRPLPQPPQSSHSSPAGSPATTTSTATLPGAFPGAFPCSNTFTPGSTETATSNPSPPLPQSRPLSDNYSMYRANPLAGHKQSVNYGQSSSSSYPGQGMMYPRSSSPTVGKIPGGFPRPRSVSPPGLPSRNSNIMMPQIPPSYEQTMYGPGRL